MDVLPLSSQENRRVGGTRRVLGNSQKKRENFGYFLRFVCTHNSDKKRGTNKDDRRDEMAMIKQRYFRYRPPLVRSNLQPGLHLGLNWGDCSLKNDKKRVQLLPLRKNKLITKNSFYPFSWPCPCRHDAFLTSGNETVRPEHK